MWLLIFCCFFSFLSGLWIYCSMREHLLSTLLSLEFMVISIFFLLIFSLYTGFYYYSLVYLVMTACEGALGLSILVIMGRTHGGDYFKNLDFILG